MSRLGIARTGETVKVRWRVDPLVRGWPPASLCELRTSYRLARGPAADQGVHPPRLLGLTRVSGREFSPVRLLEHRCILTVYESYLLGRRPDRHRVDASSGNRRKAVPARLRTLPGAPKGSREPQPRSPL